MSKSYLGELPVEVLLDNVLPFVPVPDLLKLGRSDRSFAFLCNDDTLWKRKLAEDFNFSGQGTARTSGWKFIYRGLSKPRVFVWGEKSNGRLGLQTTPKSIVSGGVPYPIQVRLPGVRVVSLVAGGMSFHALDSEGSVHVWGTLNGTWGPHAADNQGFSNVAKQAKIPHKLGMPAPIRSISCGRLHSSCWDRSNKIWTFTNWGRPFFLSSPVLSDPDYAPRHIECGWAFSALLTKSGDVFVWWPFAGTMGTLVEQKMREMDSEGDKKANAVNGVVPCVTWDLDLTPTRLPSIPTLPELLDTGHPKKSEAPALIQIAAFDNHLIGLTNHGHVLKYGSLQDEASVPHGQWEYLSQFSELERVKEHPVFSKSNDGGPKVETPKSMQITHITANFVHFVAYSTGLSSIVLVGDTDTKPESAPKIIPELQNRSVISVVIGDYHNAALTANGELLTWGAYSNGALGLGDPAKVEPGTPGGFADERTKQLALERRRGEPPAVDVPTEVRFDHDLKKPRKRFCFATTAAGWHTGALVIDLEPVDDDDEIEEAQMEDPTPQLAPRVGGAGRGRWGTPPIIPIPGIFRMGHAARSAFGQNHPPPDGNNDA